MSVARALHRSPFRIPGARHSGQKARRGRDSGGFPQALHPTPSVQRCTLQHTCNAGSTGYPENHCVAGVVSVLHAATFQHPHRVALQGPPLGGLPATVQLSESDSRRDQWTGRGGRARIWLPARRSKRPQGTDSTAHRDSGRDNWEGGVRNGR